MAALEIVTKQKVSEGPWKSWCTLSAKAQRKPFAREPRLGLLNLFPSKEQKKPPSHPWEVSSSCRLLYDNVLGLGREEELVFSKSK